MNYLISKRVLRQRNGNYGDNLIVTGKFGIKNKKQRYVTPILYNYLLELKEKDRNVLVNIENVKPNQRYMFNEFNNLNGNTS